MEILEDVSLAPVRRCRRRRRLLGRRRGVRRLRALKLRRGVRRAGECDGVSDRGVGRGPVLRARPAERPPLALRPLRLAAVPAARSHTSHDASYLPIGATLPDGTAEVLTDTTHVSVPVSAPRRAMHSHVSRARMCRSSRVVRARARCLNRCFVQEEGGPPFPAGCARNAFLNSGAYAGPPAHVRAMLRWSLANACAQLVRPDPQRRSRAVRPTWPHLVGHNDGLRGLSWSVRPHF